MRERWSRRRGQDRKTSRARPGRTTIMREKLGRTALAGAHPIRLAIPVGSFVLIAVTVGAVAWQTVRAPYATPFFHPFFTSTRVMKAWLATAVVVLACAQLVTAAHIYGRLRLPVNGRLIHAAHRWSG